MNEELYRSTFDALPEMISIVDADQTILSVNRALADRFGLPPEAFVGRKCYEVMHGTTAPPEGCLRPSLMQDPPRVEQIEVHSLQAIFEISITPLYRQDGVSAGFIHVARDVTARTKRETYRQMGHDILLAMNESESQQEANRRVVALIREATGVDAVGVRLQDDGDFPYFYHDGFSEEFLAKESSLVTRDPDGGVCIDDEGRVSLECTCGMVLSGATPSGPGFTCGGSCWTNDSAPFLQLTADEDPRSVPRNECIHEGFASVALIPIRAKGRIVGLLQLNDRKKDAFTLEQIESLEEVADSMGEAMLRKLADEKLVSNERFLRLLSENIPAMVSYWTNHLRCGFANRHFLEGYGKSSEEMLGMSLGDLLGKEGYFRDQRYIIGVLKGEPQHFERTQVKPGGEKVHVWVHYIPDVVDRVVNGFFAVISDITELKRAEGDLKVSLDLNRQIISCAQEGIIVHDRSLRYMAWNPFLEELTGVPADKVIGKSPAELFPGIVESGAMEQLQKALAGETVRGEYYFNVEETGKSGWTYNTAAPLRNEAGEIVGVIRTLSDITAHRKLEEQLRHAQRMEALGQLAGGVAHDFNNVLQIIMGYAALAELSASPDQREPLNEIVAAAERAAELTSALLSYSRKQLFKLESSDLNRLVSGVEKFLCRILGEDIAFRLQRAPGPLVAVVDKAHLQQVLVNLASNARDAMPAGGKLTIELERMEMDRHFIDIHGFGEPGAYALISVSDTGQGIPKNHLHKIFEPFFTTKAEGQGTGLGLSIVYGIVSQLRGFITCFSEVGVGTTFHLFLPLAESGEGLVAEDCRSRERVQEELTILLVEDDEGVRKVSRVVLEHYGHTVIEAQNGKEALEVFRRERGRIKLVILDALMPGLSGAETLALLQEVDPEVKALFMSGYAQHIITGKMAIPENVEFINKPVIPAKLIEAIRKTMGE